MKNNIEVFLSVAALVFTVLVAVVAWDAILQTLAQHLGLL